MWPWPFTFEPQNSTISRVCQSYSLYQVWTLWDHSFLSYAVDKQTDSKILPTPTDVVGVGNKLADAFSTVILKHHGSIIKILWSERFNNNVSLVRGADVQLVKHVSGICSNSRSASISCSRRWCKASIGWGWWIWRGRRSRTRWYSCRVRTTSTTVRVNIQLFAHCNH